MFAPLSPLHRVSLLSEHGHNRYWSSLSDDASFLARDASIRICGTCSRCCGVLKISCEVNTSQITWQVCNLCTSEVLTRACGLLFHAVFVVTSFEDNWVLEGEYLFLFLA